MSGLNEIRSNTFNKLDVQQAEVIIFPLIIIVKKINPQWNLNKSVSLNLRWLFELMQNKECLLYFWWEYHISKLRPLQVIMSGQPTGELSLTKKLFLEDFNFFVLLIISADQEIYYFNGYVLLILAIWGSSSEHFLEITKIIKYRWNGAPMSNL